MAAEADLADAPRGRDALGQIPFGLALLCFFAILFDGFDTAGLGVVVPVLAKSWALPPPSFTLALVATNLGAALGYIACGAVADRFGRRPVILVSVLWYAVFSLCTAFVDNVTVLIALRFVTALGFGGTVPTGFALAADHTPPRYREAMVIAVGTGLTMGASLGGLLGRPLIIHFGWQALFVVGGVLPLLLMPALYLWLREPPRVRTDVAVLAEPQREPFLQLFAPGYVVRTLLLWGYSFLIFCTNYALGSWVPTLLTSYGFSATDAPLGVFAMGLGGVIGNILFMPLVGRFGARGVLVFSALLAIGGVLAVGLVDLSPLVILLVLGGVGAGLVTSSVGQSALAVSTYPQAIRTTGIGWSAAMGRVGSIAGPAIGGALLALHWPARDIVQTACLPVLGAIAILMAIGWAGRGRTRPI